MILKLAISEKKQAKRRSAHGICPRFLAGFLPKWAGQSSSKYCAGHSKPLRGPQVGNPCVSLWLNQANLKCDPIANFYMQNEEIFN